MVYVLDKNGYPLMPTNRHGKVKHLLKGDKAKVVKRCPFTIKLLYESTTYTQNLTLGVDTGAGTIGTAVSKDNGDIVYMSEVAVRNDITDKMTQRAKYRRSRRNRKTRYRKARWLNRWILCMQHWAGFAGDYRKIYPESRVTVTDAAYPHT